MLYTDSPESFLSKLAKNLPQGELFEQEGFNYDAYPVRRLEDIYPDGGPLGEDARSWQVGQGMLGNCGTVADIAGFASSGGQYTIENSIFPKERSPIGAYAVRVADGIGSRWIVIDSKVPCVSAEGGPLSARPAVGNQDFWGSLLEKAAATVRGGNYQELTNQQTKGLGFEAVSYTHLTLPTTRRV